MPRGKSNKGRRGGGKTATTGSVKEDTVVEIDLDASNMDTGDCILVKDDQSQDECTSLELADDEVLYSKTETTTQSLECSDELNNKTGADENPAIELDKEKESKNEGTGVEKCIETSDKSNHVEEKLNSKSTHQDDDSINEAKDITDNNQTGSLITEQAETEQTETVHETSNIAGKDAELSFVDHQEQKNDSENIDKSKEDHSLLDVTESAFTNKTKQIMTEETGKLVDSNITHETVAAHLLGTQDVEELENSKFEEISEGSIEQAEQDDLIAESLSDVEITGESFDPKKVQNNKNYQNVKGKFKVLNKKSAYFVANNNKVKPAAENKDNDDISDASLSDHMDADLSLEEISDDELEPSKKRRKSLGHTPVKAMSDVKGGDNTKPDKDKENAGRADDMFEKVRTDGTTVKVQKHAASEDIGASKPTSNKRLKLDEKNDIEEVSSKGEEEPAFSTDVCDNLKIEAEQSETKCLDASYNRNVATSNRNLPQPSTNWRQHNTERSLESRDLIAFKRKYDMVDSSCQSEPQLLKGKIVQCNINPIKPTSEHDKQEKYTGNALIIFELLSKLKHKLPSKIPDTVISDVCSLQPSQKKGVYSISMGPLTLSDTHTSTFKDILSATENFSLVFANHGHGVLKATFAKHDDIASLFSWLSHQEPNRRDMVMSLLYSCEGEGHSSVWKATLLRISVAAVQTENQVMADDGGDRVQLYLHGMPAGVSTAFIHLLFPEALNVVTDQGTSNGIVTLDYSSLPMVEAVLASCSLLVINGSQINISHLRSLDDQQKANFSTEAVNVSDTFVKEGTEQGEQYERCDKANVNVEQGTDYNSQQNEFKAHFDITNKDESKRSPQKPSQVLQNKLASDLGKDGSLAVVGAQDVEKSLMDMESHVSMINCTDLSLPLTYSAKETNAEEKDTYLQTKDTFTERTELRNDSNENNAANKIAVQENESEKLRNQVEETEGEVASDSAQPLTEVETVIGKDKSSNLAVAEDADKLKARAQDKTRSENKSLTNKDSTLECDAEMPLQEVGSVFPEVKIPDKVVEGGDCKTSNKIAGEIQAGKENLEDVSDDEMVNHSKHENVAALIMEKDSSKVITNVDLTPGSVKDVDNIEDGDGGKKSDSHAGEGDSVRRAVESLNSTLVMTDGGLEVLMEVIDVNDGDDEVEKVIYPSTWRRSQDRPKEAAFYYSTYANKQGMHPIKQDPYKEPPAGVNRAPRQHYPWPWKESPSHKEMYGESTTQKRDSYPPSHKEMFGESTAQKRDSYPPKHRSRSPSPRRDVDSYRHRHCHDYKSYESRQSSRYGDSRRIESYSKQHDMKPSVYSSHRDPHYLERREDYKEHRPLSLSRRSESPESKVVSLHKSPYRRESPKHTSRSPISISSRSHSLSPVSKSPSVDLPQTEVEKDEIVKTVEHFLKLAKDLHQTKKRRSVRPKSSRRSSSRYSPHNVSRSQHIKRSRSPLVLSRSSRSPTYTRSSRYKYKRSPSPASQGNDRKRHYRDYSFSARKDDPYPKERDSSRNYDREKPKRLGDYSYNEESGRSKSGKWPTEQYRSPNDQPWQQTHGGYQSQSCVPAPASTIYSPSFPPPGCPSQQTQTGMYAGSSVPVYQYNSQSQYSYSNMPPSIPPTYMPNVPPPPTSSFTQPYQSTYPLYPPRF